MGQHPSLYRCLKNWPGYVLPMPTEQTWQQWLERFYNLRRDESGSHERPAPQSSAKPTSSSSRQKGI